MAIDWSVDRDGTAFPVIDANGRPTKPILLIFPGLSGGNNNLYTLSVMRKAQKEGYKCGTVIMRGCSGLPLKTPKFYCIGSVSDIEEAVNYVHKKYILDPTTGRNKQKFLAYGVSLGAMLFFGYLINAGKKAPFDGVVMYGAGWHTIEDRPFFRNNFFGFYNHGLTRSQKPLIVKSLLP
jgi:predicted alpha/beta-fold hydrolase